MNRIVLFSPVGGTDPMPQTNFRDGSLLHICRVYQPTDVYLYMSAEILANHRADNRYLYCLENLAELQGRKMACQIVERPELRDVQVFDWFYQDFRKAIKDIAANMDETDVLLLNVSSGTPAMKSGLLVLATLGEYPCKLIQVRTPMQKMNEHRHEDYDIETLWDLNEDNEEGFENRCQEIKCPSLSLIKQEEIIKKLVRSYDYEAARQVGAMLPVETTAGYRPLLELACARMQLDFPAMNKLDSSLSERCLPIKDDRKQKYFEYALQLHVKRVKKEYTDFIRAITPLLVDLFIMILKHEGGLDALACCQEGKMKWDEDKLKNEHPEVLQVLEKAYSWGGGFRVSPVYSDHLVHLARFYVKNEQIVSLLEALRHVEESVRNTAAHEIVSLSEDKIRKLTGGFDTEKIFQMIKDAFKYTGIGVSPNDWHSYEAMNERIIQQMDRY